MRVFKTFLITILAITVMVAAGVNIVKISDSKTYGEPKWEAIPIPKDVREV